MVGRIIWAPHSLSCFVKIVIKLKLTYKELTTEWCEVKAVMNSWPLRHIYENEFEKRWTPSQLCCWRQLLEKHYEASSGEDIIEIKSTKDSAKIRRYVDNIIERFWRKWQKDYMINLREPHKMRASNKLINTSKKLINTILQVVYKEGHKRKHWKVDTILRIMREEGKMIKSEDQKYKYLTRKPENDPSVKHIRNYVH